MAIAHQLRARGGVKEVAPKDDEDRMDSGVPPSPVSSCSEGDRADDEAAQMPTLKEIRSWVPKHCFVPDSRSYMYAAIDMSKLCLTFLAYRALVNAVSMPLPVAVLAHVVYSVVAGFWLWTIFVVGHDCGHGTFSKSKVVNTVLGNFFHSFVLATPYQPWQMSHHRHHMYHNHAEKDYSHMWQGDWSMFAKLDLPLNEVLAKHGVLTLMRALYVRFVTPFMAWGVYQYAGWPDGGHLVPGYGRLWELYTYEQLIGSVVSTAITVLSWWAGYTYFGGVLPYLFWYGCPWIGYGFFLFTVTFLQHHHDGVEIYNDKTWTYTRAAFETVDRTYGSLFGVSIDNQHHNISDGHVTHHLFFQQIPHYHLMDATRAVQKGMKSAGYGHLYKHEETTNFYTHVFNIRTTIPVEVFE